MPHRAKTADGKLRFTKVKTHEFIDYAVNRSKFQYFIQFFIVTFFFSEKHGNLCKTLFYNLFKTTMVFDTMKNGRKGLNYF